MLVLHEQFGAVLVSSVDRIGAEVPDKLFAFDVPIATCGYHLVALNELEAGLDDGSYALPVASCQSEGILTIIGQFNAQAIVLCLHVLKFFLFGVVLADVFPRVCACEWVVSGMQFYGSAPSL
jgi:hypothetical protein